MTDQADGDPAWLRDFPWLGGIAPQWVQAQRDQHMRRQQEEQALRERQRHLMEQWAQYDAQQHAILQGRVDVTNTGRHVAITDPAATAARSAVAPPAAPPAVPAGTGRRGIPPGSAAPPAPRSPGATGQHAIPRQARPDATAERDPLRDTMSNTVSTPPQRFGIQERPGLTQMWVDPATAWTYARPALSRHALAGVLVLLAFAGGAEVIFLWWLQTPAARLQTLGDQYIMGAQLTGLLGAYLLLIEIALMARIPWLERRIGSWLATLHRGLGAYLIVLLAAHMVLVVAGYSLSLKAPPSLVIKDIFATYPYVLAATVGYAALLALGVSSIKHFRHKLGYDRWHSLHLVAYPAAVAAFFHQVFLGAQFTRNAYAKDTWIAMHVIVAAAILLYRVGIPVSRTLKYRLRVVGVVVEATDTVSIYVGGVHLERLGAQAGQYFRWRFLGRGLWYQTHPFSLSAAPTNGVLRLTVKGVGNYTRRLKRRIRPGVRVIADGPYGAFTAELRRRQRVLLVGGGVGVTPLRAIAETLDGSEGDVIFLQRASDAAGLLMQDELVKMDDERKIIYIPVLGKRGKTPKEDPMYPGRLRQMIPDLDEREVFICGSPSMARSTIKNLRKAGIPWRRIHTELFDF
jgi:predicted ferric reductase